MADQNRTTPPGLMEKLAQAPYEYGFFQLLRRLECLYKTHSRFGQSLRPSQEPPLRFGQDISLHFEHSTLTGLQPRKAGLAPVLKQRFFGLFGLNGPMPLPVTEYIRDRRHFHKDHTLAGFADIFHHRLLGLFYRAFADTQPTFSFDRPDQDRFAGYIGSLSGLGGKAWQNRDAMPDLAKYYYTGLLAARSKSAEGLRALLADYFNMPVRIEPFVGEWLSICATDQTRLGRDTALLSQAAVLGGRVWSIQYKFRVCFGPLTLTQYLSLLPAGQCLTSLVAVIRNYLGDELSWDVNLILKRAEVPGLQLGQSSRLGWTSWLGRRSADSDADELRLNPFWANL